MTLRDIQIDDKASATADAAVARADAEIDRAIDRIVASAMEAKKARRALDEIHRLLAQMTAERLRLEDDVRRLEEQVASLRALAGRAA